ncbi:MAG: NADP-dependent phosphogluconate dehydrogenase [Saprospiraceae bacterium]|nr:NADP-dependent phosphogluconate dehydrogenase [Saprospiraceae bacterium]
MGKIIIIMGVSGSGKTTVGKVLAKKMRLPFYDGDDYHSKENLDKMKSGLPLNDIDRAGWLKSLNEVAKTAFSDEGAIFACSALKENYRETLRSGINGPVHFVFLEGQPKLIKKRMRERSHFMPPQLLESQFESLEVPAYALKISIEESPVEIVNKIISHMNQLEFGVAGIGVMGRSISRNLATKGFRLALFNRNVPGKEEKVAATLIDKHSELRDSVGFEDLKAFVNSLQKPRKILLMVDAGAAVDAMIDQLTPHLKAGDIVIDGGNSFYRDTQKRTLSLAKKGIYFMGCGISGGESGALIGPAIMPGGDKKAYEKVESFLVHIAARDERGMACCAYVGPAGSGHFVKMVHNGIEYAEMQLIAEIYEIMRFGKGMDPDQIARVFEKWNEGYNSSYLLEITAAILKVKEKGKWIVDLILDNAGSKGTGSWTAEEAIQSGLPYTLVHAALNARFLSSQKTMRQKLERRYKSSICPIGKLSNDTLAEAFYMARIINHHQGFSLIRYASEKNDWQINLEVLAGVWTNGCIIRSSLMGQCRMVFEKTASLPEEKHIKKTLHQYHPKLLTVVSKAIKAGLDIPCLSASANYFNGITNGQANANIIQAQRDYFGAHTFRWKNDPEGANIHYPWI